jgi:hypothetical protein
MKSVKISAKIQAAKTMPPLRHSLPGQEFDIAKSEVVQWLTNQPEILQWLFESVKDKALIAYNPSNGTWQGVDYAD